MTEQLTPARFETGADYKERSPRFKDFMEGTMVRTQPLEYSAHLEFERELSTANDQEKIGRVVEKIERSESLFGRTQNTRSMRARANHRGILLKTGQSGGNAELERLTVARVANEIEIAETAEKLEEVKKLLEDAENLFGPNTVFSDLHSYAILTGFERFRP